LLKEVRQLAERGFSDKNLTNCLLKFYKFLNPQSQNKRIQNLEKIIKFFQRFVSVFCLKTKG
jgi:L-2-hydroxyglutarate oxidase LhgO